MSIQSFEITGTDTCNRIDTKERKQGLCHTCDLNDHGAIKDTLFYKDGMLIKNNSREGQ